MFNKQYHMAHILVAMRWLALLHSKAALASIDLLALQHMAGSCLALNC
jgi:hypothetical protein